MENNTGAEAQAGQVAQLQAQGTGDAQVPGAEGTPPIQAEAVPTQQSTGAPDTTPPAPAPAATEEGRNTEEKRIKGLQRVISRKDVELQQTQGELNKLKGTLEKALKDGAFADEESATAIRKQLSEVNTSLAASAKTQADAVLKDIWGDITSAGLDPNSGAFRMARFFYESGRFEDARAEVDDVLSRQNPKKEEVKPVTTNNNPATNKPNTPELTPELEAAVLQKYGLNKNPGEPPAGTAKTYTTKSIMAMSDEEYTKTFAGKNMLELISTGVIKTE